MDLLERLGGCIQEAEEDKVLINVKRLYKLGYLLLVNSHKNHDVKIYDIHNIDQVLNIDEFCIECSESIEPFVSLNKSILCFINIEIKDNFCMFSGKKYSKCFNF